MYQRVFAGGLLIVAMVFSLQDAQCKALTKDISRCRLPFLYIKSDIILEVFSFFRLKNTLSLTLTKKKVILNLILESHLADIFTRYLEVWFLAQKHFISLTPVVAQISTLQMIGTKTAR